MRVNIEHKAWTDIRFEHLGRLLKIPTPCAVGAMAYLWFIAQENETPCLQGWFIEAKVPLKNFILHAMSVGLLELGEGETYLIKGIEERLEQIKTFKEKQREKGIISGSRRNQRLTEIEPAVKINPVLKRTPMSMSPSMSPSGSEKQNTGEGTGKGDMSETHFPPSAAASEGTALVSHECSNNVQLIEAEVVDEKPKTPRKPKPKPLVSEADENLGKRWHAWSATLAPHINATPASFSVGIFETKRALARSIPNGDLDALLDALFTFIQKDRFWGKNCLSPCGLLAKSSNGLRKVDNVIKDMRKGEFREKQKSLSPEEETDWSKFI